MSITHEYKKETTFLFHFPRSPPTFFVFLVDGTVVATATSTAAGKECSSGPLTVDYKVAPPYSLSAGPHDLEVTFTTADGFDHVDSFYKIELSTP